MSRACPESIVPQPWSLPTTVDQFPQVKVQVQPPSIGGVNSGGRIEYLPSQSVPKLPGGFGGLVRVSAGCPRVEEDGHQQESPSDSSGTYRWMSFILKGWEGCGVTLHFPGPSLVSLEWHGARGYSAPKVQCHQPSACLKSQWGRIRGNLPGASVRNSAHGKGHEEGGLAYAKA